MLDHVSITVSDIAAAERFYDAIMATRGSVASCRAAGCDLVSSCFTSGASTLVRRPTTFELAQAVVNDAVAKATAVNTSSAVEA